MNADRALEIIASHGADAGRWPEAERQQVLALAATDGAIAAAIAEARQLDGLLTQWAHDVAPAAFDTAAIVGAAPVASPAWQRWFAGGAVAAAVAAGFVIFGASQPQTMSTARITMNATVPSATADSDADGFASVFTPTVDEDELI